MNNIWGLPWIEFPRTKDRNKMAYRNKEGDIKAHIYERIVIAKDGDDDCHLNGVKEPLNGNDFEWRLC